jgi:uncharacterized membrane protein
MINSENYSKANSDNNPNQKIYYWLIALASIGFFDASFLTAKYFSGHINCSIISGCQDVLTSNYSHIGPIPTAILGIAYYLTIIFGSLVYLRYRLVLMNKLIKILPIFGLAFSLWLTYLQIWVIKALCQYCLLSALISLSLFILSFKLPKNKKNDTPAN